MYHEENHPISPKFIVRMSIHSYTFQFEHLQEISAWSIFAGIADVVVRSPAASRDAPPRQRFRHKLVKRIILKFGGKVLELNWQN